MFRIVRASLFAALTALICVSALAADKYPSNSIRIVVPFSPGGGTDLLSRAVQPRLERVLGVNVIVENRPGAGGTIGVSHVAKSAPDGYTFLVSSASYTFSPGIYKKKLPYDAIKDFQPLTMLSQQATILAVHPSLPVKSVKELIAQARKNPKSLFYASGGFGSNLHMTTELFKYMAKIEMKHVPYKGGGPALIALVTGEVPVSFTGILSSRPFRESGKVRGLAVTTKERAPAVPELPSLHEAGVTGYDKGAWTGMYAPAAVPKAIIEQIYAAVAKVMKDPATVKALAGDGFVPVANPPAAFTKFVHDEIAEWNNLIREMKL